MENIPNLVEKIDIQIQETQRVPTKMNLNRPTPRVIIIKMVKARPATCPCTAPSMRVMALISGRKDSFNNNDAAHCCWASDSCFSKSKAS